MYARVGTAQDKPGKIEDAIRIYRDSVVPAQKQQKGFKGALFLTDRHTGRSISISLWETEADMEASMASGFYQEQTDKFSQDFEAKPIWEEYDVSVQV
jgi:heme-degrading monooxygenase HmoA